jgi:beta-galactosidase
LEPFKAHQRKAFNGMCLAIIQSEKGEGTIKLKAKSEGLQSAQIQIETKK